ncbi:hypothetical protein [Streptomyces sp. YS-3]|uniref:hypothetical protein n=1 Tax=Streptomyces sp. YS-3 TaxID=3381352 RepID=UPI003862C327
MFAAPRAHGTPETWTDLTDDDNPDYPDHVCGISINAQGNDAWIKAVTTDGTVYQTHGDTQTEPRTGRRIAARTGLLQADSVTWGPSRAVRHVTA